MVDVGPVGEVPDSARWSADEWAAYWDAHGCPHAAALWRDIAALQAGVQSCPDEVVVQSLIGTEWR